MSVLARSLSFMGKVIFDSAATLNGFLADEHGSLDWLFQVPGAESAAGELIPSDATVLVEGSRPIAPAPR